MVKFRDFKNDEIIIRKDDTGDSMFFILDGEALVISQYVRQIFAELVANSFFGEVSLFYSVHRTATVRAKVFTTVIEISKTVLETVLEQHPDLKSTMMKKAKENYDLFLQRQKALKELKAAAKQDVDEYEVEATVQRLKKVISSVCLPTGNGFLSIYVAF
jgi:CRP-like cAMP-binding protein